MHRREFIPGLAVLLAGALVGCPSGKEEPRPPSPPGSPAALHVVDGQGQLVAPSAPAKPVVVSVLDQNGTPVPGVATTWAVVSGEGQLAETVVLTDAAGQASNVWTLGPATGLNSAVAAVDGLAPVTFTALGVVSSPDLDVIIVKPDPTKPLLDGTSLPIEVHFNAVYSVTHVAAILGSTSIELSCRNFVCTGDIPVDPQLPFGPIALLAYATDAVDHTSGSGRVLVVDRPPAPRFDSPVDGAVARPSLLLSARCVDDDPAGCPELTLIVRDPSTGGVPMLSGRDSLSSALDLSRWPGRRVQLDLVGVDSGGHQVVTTQFIYVDPSALLTLRAVVPGKVLDVVGVRVLYVDPSGAIRVRDTSSGEDRVLEQDQPSAYAARDPGDGHLMAAGAIYLFGPTVHEWRDGTVTELTSPTYADPGLKFAGDYAIYYKYDTAGSLERRDLSAGTAVTVKTGGGPRGMDVAPNGDVVYATIASSPFGVFEDGVGCNVFRWRDGVVTMITDNSLDARDGCGNPYGFPLTDGTDIVYGSIITSFDYSPDTIRFPFLFDGSQSVQLGTGSPSTYAVQNGWVAFTQPDVNGLAQVWRHGPSGNAQVSVFGDASSAIDAIGPDGTIFFTHAGSRYRAVVGSAAERIGIGYGSVVFREGKALVLLGDSVLEVTP